MAGGEGLRERIAFGVYLCVLLNDHKAEVRCAKRETYVDIGRKEREERKKNKEEGKRKKVLGARHARGVQPTPGEGRKITR